MLRGSFIESTLRRASACSCTHRSCGTKPNAELEAIASATRRFCACSARRLLAIAAFRSPAWRATGLEEPAWAAKDAAEEVSQASLRRLGHQVAGSARYSCTAALACAAARWTHASGSLR